MNTSLSNFFRKWHRDIAYFYVGLILAFSISGIALNHRRTFDSRQYTYQTEQFSMAIEQDESNIDDDYIKGLIPELGMDSDYRTFRLREGALRIYFEDALVEIDIASGKGEKEWLRRRILLGEMADLHQTTNSWWVWYSDIFGVGMLLIAISGLFISQGQSSFRKRGWWMATLGLVFPLIFLIFLI